MYKQILKPIFFKLNPETVHNRILRIGVLLGKFWITRKIISSMFNYENKMLNCNVLGINFKNPIGLSAGFDKNAILTGIIPCVGFGFMEVGSITAEKCLGNPKPRLFRLPKDNALAVNYGLCNDGAIAIHKRLEKKKFAIPIGISVARTN